MTKSSFVLFIFAPQPPPPPLRGLPKTDPLAYWLFTLVGLKEMSAAAGKPAMLFFEVRTESFKNARWAKRWFESCATFESNVASAKLTSREEYVNEVFAEGDAEDNVKTLGTFVNVREKARTFALNAKTSAADKKNQTMRGRGPEGGEAEAPASGEPAADEAV